MGLDWNVLNKPKPGKEQRFTELFLILDGKKEADISFWDKLLGRYDSLMKELQNEFFEISISSFETLGAPRVGFDEEANKWMRGHYEDRHDQSWSMEEFLKQHHGYYVVELVPENDGIPNYVAMGGDRQTFRAAFLNDCEEILGEELFNEAYTSKLAAKTLDYGKRMMAVADSFAQKHGLGDVKNHKRRPKDGSTESDQAHILFSAAKWLIWWGERGHGYEADF